MLSCGSVKMNSDSVIRFSSSVTFIARSFLMYGVNVAVCAGWFSAT